MENTTLIRSGWLIDGSGGPVRKDMALRVASGRFITVEPFEKAAVGPGEEVLDLSFATILPPLIDSHLHLTMSGTVDNDTREFLRRADCDELTPVIAKNLEQLAVYGVVAVRDGGDRHGCVARYLEQEDKQTEHLHVQSPGQALHLEGRYGALIGRAVKPGQSLVDCLSEQSASSWVKLVNSGLNSLKDYGRLTKSQFSIDEMRALVGHASRYGKKVMVHANGVEAVRSAVEAGCHSIEHGFFMGRDNLMRMADSDCVWVPTAVTMKAYTDILSFQGDNSGADVARRNLEHQLNQLRQARALGVRIALGTDAGSPGVLHGESVFEEMKLLAKAGFDLSEIVRSATSTGAELLGLQGRGLIAEGRLADFIVVRGTPAQMPRKLSYLEGIYFSGRPAPFYRKNPEKHVPSTS